MFTKLVKENVRLAQPLPYRDANGRIHNLIKCPEVDHQHFAQNGMQLSIGDLHANALKFMYFLIRHGVVQLDPRKKDVDYSRFHAIYTLPYHKIELLHLNYLSDILAKATVNSDAAICLIGDELCDRGSNDLFVLEIYKLLVENNVNVKTLLSNHALEFIMAYETRKPFNQNDLNFQNQANSSNAFQYLIDAGLVSQDHVTKLIDFYKSTLKIVSYSLHPDNNGISIYSHAPIDLSTIKSLSREFNVSYDDSTPHLLADTIDKINELFSSIIQRNKLHEWIEKRVLGSKFINSETHPIEFIVWNRQTNILDRSENYNGYSINYVHGHDSRVPSNANVYNLDNILGKVPNRLDGEYTALYSQYVDLRNDCLLDSNESDKINNDNAIFYSIEFNSNDFIEENESQSTNTNLIEISEVILSNNENHGDINEEELNNKADKVEMIENQNPQHNTVIDEYCSEENNTILLKKEMPLPQKTYQFGDVSRAVGKSVTSYYSTFLTRAPAPASSSNNGSQNEYHFGNFTRSLFGYRKQ